MPLNLEAFAWGVVSVGVVLSLIETHPLTVVCTASTAFYLIVRRLG